MGKVTPTAVYVAANTGQLPAVRAGSQIAPTPVHSVAKLALLTIRLPIVLPAFTFTVPTRVGGWATSATAGTVSGLSPPRHSFSKKTFIVSKAGATHAPARIEVL